MKRLTKLALVGALALMSAAPAMADTINFDTLDPTIFGGGETFTESGYTLEVVDGGSGGFAGAIGNGNDPFQCEVASCPSGNSSYFYFGVNDGGLKITRNDQLAFRLSSLDYAFLAPIGGLPGYSYGQLTVTGTTVAGASVHASFDFPTLVGGSSPFVNANLFSQFGSTSFSNVTVSSCVFDGENCINPASYQAQFALDNLVLAPVPEPETYAMMGLGLAAIGLVARRRAKKQFTI